MWSVVAPECDATNNKRGTNTLAPSARAKHSATLVGEHVFLLGGRNGNLPTRDFWKYNLITGKWHQIKPSGDKLPCLQEHTAVAYKDCLYVFGGEVGFSAGTETPLWVYDIKGNTWKKKRTKKGVATPKGRRGHTALVHNGSMIVYGGYQDLRGSCSELWAFHFVTESWHLVSTSTARGQEASPPPRHKHSAVLQGDTMWIYGGMTDLQERADLWRWDIPSRTWYCVKSKVSPGPLHSHAACRLPSSSMLVFGGEKGGHNSNELWKFSFALETWEKIIITSTKPKPRSECVAITVPELLLNGSSMASYDYRSAKIRTRTCTSADRSNRHSSYLPNNKVVPSERTYVFHPSHPSQADLAQQFSESKAPTKSFLQEIQQLSQLNIPRLSNKCSYTVLTGCAGDSTESLLRQHTQEHHQEVEVIDTDLATPPRGVMVKSKSAYAIKKKYQLDISPTTMDADNNKPPQQNKKRVEFDCTTFKLAREPISVPNFSTLNLATPVLTPVEAAKLVYLDSEEEEELEEKKRDLQVLAKVEANNEKNIYENFQPIQRDDSYSSHIGYADNPLYQEMMISLLEKSVSSTSDYASIETVNRLSSASSYSVKSARTGVSQDDRDKPKGHQAGGPFGFCNPNYIGPDADSDKKKAVRMLAQEETVRISDDEGMLELQEYNGVLGNNKVVFRNSSRGPKPPKTLKLERSRSNLEKSRALSAGRTENGTEKPEKVATTKAEDKSVGMHVYVFGGKEQGQVTVFQRPISVWRLKLC